MRSSILTGAALIALSAFPSPGPANPLGGQVTGGSASIDQTDPRHTRIDQRSDRAILEWDSFGIGAGEHTSFHQPSSSAVALNRVRGPLASNILGELTANGRVFLINPAGILFGAGARVDVGGLIATTSDIADQDFLAGRFGFDRPSGNGEARVVNRGEITVPEGGSVLLAAPFVHNAGTIAARLGRVTLAGVKTFTVDFDGDGLMQFEAGQAVGEGDTDAAQLVLNNGSISADGGVVELTGRAARGVVRQAINVEGLIESRAVGVRGGTIVLSGGEHGVVSVGGTLDASGGQAGQAGGQARVSGERVNLRAGARIDVSGERGGGTALIGGDRDGRGVADRTLRTHVDPEAVVTADAGRRGDGGRVVLWSEDQTQAFGTLSARGGEAGGDGGSVTVASADRFDFRADLDLTAARGRAGTFLLAAKDIDIVDDQHSAGGAFGRVGDDVADEFLERIDGNVVVEARGELVFGHDFDGDGLPEADLPDGLSLARLGAGERVEFRAGGNILLGTDVTTQGADLLFAPGGTLRIGAEGADRAISVASGGGAVAVSGTTLLNDALSVDTGGGALAFSGTLDGTEDLLLAAGPEGDIAFGGDVGQRAALGDVRITSAEDVRIGGRFIAGQTEIGHTGALTSPVGSLEVLSLFVNPDAASAHVFGTVGGVSGEAAAFAVAGPFGDPEFTINGCVIGTGCLVAVPPPPPPTPRPDPPPRPRPPRPEARPPAPPPEAEPVRIDPTVEPRPTSVGLESARVDDGALLSLEERRPPSDDLTDPSLLQYSNFGSEERWDEVGEDPDEGGEGP